MEEIKKVFILAVNESAAGAICDKLNRSRPVHAEYFLEIPEFLNATLSDNPDFLVVSMEFRHPRVDNFPLIFKSATGKPVIAATETGKPEFGRLVNRCKAPIKISGKMTSHNIWVKIVSYLKEENKQKLDSIKGGGSNSKKTNSVTTVQGSIGNHTKEESGHTHLRAKKIQAILADLNNGREKNSDENSGTSNQASGLGSFHDKGDAYGGSNGTSGFGSSDGHSTTASNLDSKKTGINSQENSRASQGGKLSGSAGDMGQVNSGPDSSNSQNSGFGKLDTSNGNSQIGNSDRSPYGRVKGKGSKKSSAKEAPTELDRRLDAGGRSQNKTGSMGSASNPLDKHGLQNGNSNGSLSPSESKNSAPGGQGEKPKDGVHNRADGSKGSPTSPHADSKNNQSPSVNPKDNTKKNQDSTATNKVAAEKISALEAACREAIEMNFLVKTPSEPGSFDSTKLMVIAINQKNFKGYLTLANSFDAIEEPSLLLELKSNIQLKMEERGHSGELSEIVNIDVTQIPFADWANEKCEFAIQGEENSGKQFCLSFLPRKKVLPPFKMAEDRSRILVNLQHIPPGTNVNFNGYIYLQRNNRYVRVLKKGGSLALDQIKRFMKSEKYQNFHIPLEDKKFFFQFYVHNRLNWEFVTYLKELEDKKQAA